MPDTRHEASRPLSAPDASELRPTGAARHADKALPHALRGILALQDFEEPARRYLPRPMFGYVSGGAETNASLRANRAAFDDFAFLPRVLVDVSARTTKTTLFGRGYDAPFGIAPMGGSSMAAYQGDIVLARTATEANIPMIMSGASLARLEDVRAAGRTAWFQAYLPGETAPITRLVDRVARAVVEHRAKPAPRRREDELVVGGDDRAMLRHRRERPPALLEDHVVAVLAADLEHLGDVGVGDAKVGGDGVLGEP